MKVVTAGVAASFLFLVFPASAQAPDLSGSLTGVWLNPVMRGAPYSDPVPLNRAQPPLKPEHQAEYDAKLKAQAEATAAGKPLYQADDTCDPYGMPTMMMATHPIEILETPGRITIIAEIFNEIRRVHMGKEQTKPEDTEPTFAGHSVGRWEGNTLVIDTVGVKDYVQTRQVPHSNQMRIVERISFISKDQIRNDVTITDPVYLSKPWTFGWRYDRLTDYDMSEFVCEDNRQYQDETGAMRLRLTR